MDTATSASSRPWLSRHTLQHELRQIKVAFNSACERGESSGWVGDDRSGLGLSLDAIRAGHTVASEVGQSPPGHSPPPGQRPRTMYVLGWQMSGGDRKGGGNARTPVAWTVRGAPFHWLGNGRTCAIYHGLSSGSTHSVPGLCVILTCSVARFPPTDVPELYRHVPDDVHLSPRTCTPPPRVRLARYPTLY